MEAVLDPSPKPAPGPRRNPFEGVDLREAGRRGGLASGVTRRMRKQRELEEKIAQTKNGAAIFGLLRTQLERDQALERERLRLDRLVNHLMDEADRERATIDRLRERRRECEAAISERMEAVEALDRRERLLAAAVAASETELAARLRDLDDDNIERILEKTGRLERVEAT